MSKTDGNAATAARGLTVLVCAGQPTAAGAAGDLFDPTVPTSYDELRRGLLPEELSAIVAQCRDWPIHLVGPRPGKAIDALLTGRILVVGGDADLNAVVLRLLRKELLGAVEVAYASPRPTVVTDMYLLPTGAEAVRAARHAEVDLVPLVRNDSGGVLVGAAELAPVTGTFYVDSQRIPGGSAKTIEVVPSAQQGLAVTIVRKKVLGFGRLPVTYHGRAVEFGIVPGSGTQITFDGIRHPREVQQWVFYQHTAPLRLVRGIY